MRNPAYLACTKSGIFYLRWPVPKALHPGNKQSFIKLSLDTRDPKNALKLSRALVHIGEQINHLGIVSNMRFDEVLQLLRQHFREMLDIEKERINSEGRLTSVQLSGYREKLKDTQRAIAEGGAWFGGADDHRILQAFMRRHEVNFSPDSKEYGWLQDNIKRAYESYLISAMAYDKSLDSFDLNPLTPQTQQDTVKSKNREHRILLGEVVKRFLTERMAGSVWAERTKIEKKDHTNLLLEIIPANTDIATISAKSAAAVKDTLMALPPNWRKRTDTRNRTLTEVVAMGLDERLKPATLNKYLHTYADLFGWACSNGFTERNHFSGLNVKFDKNRMENPRKAFTDAQVRTILKHVVDDALINVRKPYQKWGPLIAAYTGARLNEIAQIELTDIKVEGDIWYFNISDLGDDQSVKTSASKRKIPIHAKILDAGLLSYVDELRQMRKLHLFPELRYSREHGRGRNLSRWFNEALLPRLGMGEPGYVFHSFRHSVNNKLVHAVSNDALIKAVMGHQQQGMTYSVYLKEGFRLTHLKEAVETISYATDVSD